MNAPRLTTLMSLTLLAAPAALALPCAQWSTATLSAARAQMGATSVDGVALFAGGNLSGMSSLSTDPTDTVDLYDAGTAVWSQATLSSARTSPAATSVNGLALFAGGSLVGDTPSDAVDIYDASTGSWSLAQLSLARTAIGATTVGRYAVFAGGSLDRAGTMLSDVVDVFDSVTGIWSAATLPQPVRFAQAASLGDRAVIFSDDGFSRLMLFDPSTGTSTEIDRPAGTTGQLAPGLATTPGQIWLVGGGDPWFPFEGLAHIYDVDQGLWSTRLLSEARLGMGVATTSTKLIAAGGLICVPFSPCDTSTVDVLDLLSLTSTSTQLSTPRSFPSAVEVDGQVIIAGGFVNNGSGRIVCDAVDIFDDTLGTLYCNPAIPNSTGAAASIRLEGAPGTLANGPVSLVATHLPEASAGYFLASLTQAFVPNAGGSQGTLCLGGSVGRYAASPFFTALDGTGTQVVDLTSLPGPAGSVSALASETWSFQAWFRDANPTATTNFTPGVSLLIQ